MPGAVFELLYPIGVIVRLEGPFRLGEGGGADRCRRFSEEGDIFQIGAIMEGVVPNQGDARGNRDSGQAGATVEGAISDGGHAGREFDRLQVLATGKGAASDCGHGRGNFVVSVGARIAD